MCPQTKPRYIGGRGLIWRDGDTNDREKNCDTSETEDAHKCQFFVERYANIPKTNDRNRENYCRKYLLII